ncbi:PiT family inorganic phosphate transporter [Methanomicrobium sp. W14]|uniref:inorganic phosphate transporter n=1 Tax=Methanomicrobium sp. W14 TaxID=2817839 RepID=UPI001AE95D45|nr:inorganic phosphate transporter [Methanomicrobium sp. W14]MBP2132955.1 PiT family inorganic phosphate transporter [Methanomicrobium sp. W14]
MLDLALATIILAFAFTFTNGFQDASSIAATFIASRSATPKQGISVVAGMSLLGAVLGGSAVAFTLSGLISVNSGPTVILVLLSAIISATFWNLFTWKFGLPSSSTHALIGGLIGAAIAGEGIGSVFWGVNELLMPGHELAGLVKIIVFLLISVAIGFFLGYIIHKISMVALRNQNVSINRKIIKINWLAAALIAFSNGANDSQKQLGIIALVLFAAGSSATLEVPMWARIICAVFIALGTLSGGWRIMKTLGNKIFKIKPIHSFDSQVSSGVAIGLSTIAGAPVSSTHIISTSVLGVGAAENPKKVQWEVGKEIIIAMILTIPATMLISSVLCYGLTYVAGV